MKAVVFDTNVLLVADGKAEHMSPSCIAKCAARLEQAKREERIVLDRSRLILDEYTKKFTKPRGQPSAGDLFLRWLLANLTNENHVTQVAITPTDGARTCFKEFPGDEALEARFDPNDRKFVATANAHPMKPPIVQAADSKWLIWEAALQRHHIQLEFPCRDELVPFSKPKKSRRS